MPLWRGQGATLRRGKCRKIQTVDIQVFAKTRRDNKHYLQIEPKKLKDYAILEESISESDRRLLPPSHRAGRACRNGNHRQRPVRGLKGGFINTLVPTLKLSAMSKEINARKQS